MAFRLTRSVVVVAAVAVVVVAHLGLLLDLLKSQFKK
jgi:Flp pilus assembly pilin Flp